MDGILNLNKPADITSFEAVTRVRNLADRVKAGHAGTLDPMATGVLPILLGQARRLAEYFLDLGKSYRAVILLGRETDTLDITGKTISNMSIDCVNQSRVEEVLNDFIGDINQTPPVYSALKISGIASHRLARRGLPLEPATRNVKIYDIKLVDYQLPYITLDIHCGRGTYIRSLARDLGNALGTCGCLSELVRTSYGPFKISEAIELAEIEALTDSQALAICLHPIDAILADIDSVILDEENERLVCNGVSVNIRPSKETTRLCRAYNHKGNLVALLVSDERNSAYKPEKVFLKQCSS